MINLCGLKAALNVHEFFAAHAAQVVCMCVCDLSFVGAGNYTAEDNEVYVGIAISWPHHLIYAAQEAFKTK